MVGAALQHLAMPRISELTLPAQFANGDGIEGWQLAQGNSPNPASA
jgi:hypothetical protein